MAHVGRLAGAILLETNDQFFLVGDLKEPCKFEDRGFVSPAERDVLKAPSIPLRKMVALLSGMTTISSRSTRKGRSWQSR